MFRLLLFAVAFAPACTENTLRHPLPEFTEFRIVRPRVYHGREKRHVINTRVGENSLKHVPDITLGIDIDDEEKLVDLTLNRDLVTRNLTFRHQENGLPVVTTPSPEEVEICHYQGDVRGIPDSWAAISTCDGVRGVIFDGEDMHYIDKALNSGAINGDHWGDHFVYSHQHLSTNLTCGYEGTNERHHHKGKHRVKRGSDQLIRGPYNASRRSRYVELVLVMDNKVYKGMESSLPAVHARSKDIANIINALYTPLDIFVALVGVVVWTEVDEIALSTKGDNTLTSFLHYRRERLVKQLPNDNAQLLTKVQFEGGVVGKALKGPICTFEFSGGVSMDHSPLVGLVATTVAHEMGHNFGMEHDTSECDCPDDRCIMAPSSSSTSPTRWSSCSLEYLSLAFEHGMDYCLRNKPERLFDSPVCGNGFVEVGEQCDCGLKDRCNNPCCNASTCMLFANASCATGECCDFSTCRPKEAGTICRTADHECDLPEFCTGESEYCPTDVFKMDGETCDKGKAFCYQGSCRTHNDQCKLLWGPSGKSSNSQCYRMNMKGSRHGNCGYNRLNQSYIKCIEEDIYCGMLHCMHMNERLEFGMESVAILSHSFINSGGSIIPCRTAIVDLGLNEVDPGLSPDGSKCAEGKMCVGQKCMPVGNLVKSTACQSGCNGRGVCNSLGHCHCEPGFAPPLCKDAGTGGSVDSGPATHPDGRKEVITAFYIVFLGIVPTIALASLFIYYIKRNAVFGKKPRTMTHEKRAAPPSNICNGGIRGGGRDVAKESSTSLLPRQNGSVSPLQEELIGQFKGFTVTPLPNGTPASASGPAIHPTRPAPDPPPPYRPLISAPVLAATTAQHLVSPSKETSIPSRPAPVPPQEAIVLPIRPAPPAPRHENILTTRPAPAAPVSESVLSAPDCPSAPLPSVPKQASALDRIASFMKGKDRAPVKKKIDREILRGIEISNPIPQNEITLPQATLPVGDRNVVMRAQSMRESVKGRRPGIPSFGSMRESKRPSSIGSMRPTNPPPRPPTNKGDSAFDDCLNLLTEGSAPLANIDEESPSSPKENIYSVIDESGRNSPEYKVPRALEIIPDSGESMGLLGEIVSEIESRNTESIYSASTLRKKKPSPTSPPMSDYSTCPSDSQYANMGYSEATTKSLSSASSNSDYLSPTSNPKSLEEASKDSKPLAYKPNGLKEVQKPARPDVANNKEPEKKTQSDQDSKNNIFKRQLPDTPVVHKESQIQRSDKDPPTYKPAFQRNAGPILAAVIAKKSPPPPVRKHSTLSSKPDLLSSCTQADEKSPDIVAKPNAAKLRYDNKSSTFKPEIKMAKPEPKTLADKASSLKTSNVAALQQRFENKPHKVADAKPISVKR